MFGSSNGDRGRFLINIGLVAVIILVFFALVTSIYQQTMVGDASEKGFWRDPQIIALGIGALLSVLFVDRWRSLENKVDSLSKDQNERLKDIQSFTKEHVELQVGQVVDKAEKVSAKIASIAERHPWLEVITERDIIVETESLRGILRTAYSMLKGGKNYLHLFEYLEYCSQKGTRADPRDDHAKKPLRGTADDFLEIASFCEIWLGDYALASQFIQRYIDQAGSAAYKIYPDYIRRLLRVGDMPAAVKQTKQLDAIMRRDQLFQMLPFLGTRYPMSNRYRWQAANALAVAYAAFGKRPNSQRYVAAAHASPYSQLFASEQVLVDAEVSIHNGVFEDALVLLTQAEEGDSSVFLLRDRIVLLEFVGEFGRAAELRQRLEAQRNRSYGDDQKAAEAVAFKRSTPRTPTPASPMDLPESSDSALAQKVSGNDTAVEAKKKGAARP